MGIDLSSLEGFDEPLAKPAAATAKPAAEPSGKPLDIPLADIEEDPDQPRREFSPEAMEQMVASIKVSGVKTPVSLKPHPTLPGKWLLNYGARRFRGSKEAGKTTIPAWVDDQHDDYEQAIENLVREDLTPMDIARFIARKLGEGDSKGQIAKRLHRPAKFVTVHLALIEPPACITAAYDQGKTKSPEILYNLRALAEKHPTEVAEWVESQDDITRQAVADLTEELTGKKKTKPQPAQEGQGGHGRGSSGAAGEGESGQGGGGFSPEKTEGDERDEKGEGSGGDSGRADQPPVQKLPPHNPAHEKALATEKKDDPSAIKKAVLLVEYDERPAMVLLNRRPSTQGLLHIKYEDNGEEVEVDAGRCKINCLIEASN